LAWYSASSSRKRKSHGARPAPFPTRRSAMTLNQEGASDFQHKPRKYNGVDTRQVAEGVR
jgi:hypothetical protein